MGRCTWPSSGGGTPDTPKTRWIQANDFYETVGTKERTFNAAQVIPYKNILKSPQLPYLAYLVMPGNWDKGDILTQVHWACRPDGGIDVVNNIKIDVDIQSYEDQDQLGMANVYTTILDIPVNPNGALKHYEAIETAITPRTPGVLAVGSQLLFYIMRGNDVNTTNEIGVFGVRLRYGIV